VTALNPLELGLPHREPFVFVDSVMTLVPGEQATGCKLFTPETPFFRGHFPGDPLVPGVILAESLAQLAGLVAGQPGRGLRLAAIKTMKFPGAVRPDETITLTAQKLGATAGLWQFAVEARVGLRVVAEGVIVLAEQPAA